MLNNVCNIIFSFCFMNLCLYSRLLYLFDCVYINKAYHKIPNSAWMRYSQSDHYIIGFPAHFRHLFIQFYKNVFSMSSHTLWNVRLLVSILSLFDQFWNIVIQFRALPPVFVTCNSTSSVTVAEHETSKNNFVYWHSFSSKFQSNSSPRCKGPITLDEFEWQNTEFVRRNDEFDPTFLTCLVT